MRYLSESIVPGTNRASSIESKDEAERTDRSVFLVPGSGELFGVRVGARFDGIRRVGANESVSEVPHDGHSTDSSRISLVHFGQRIVGGGLYHSIAECGFQIADYLSRR